MPGGGEGSGADAVVRASRDDGESEGGHNRLRGFTDLRRTAISILPAIPTSTADGTSDFDGDAPPPPLSAAAAEIA